MTHANDVYDVIEALFRYLLRLIVRGATADRGARLAALDKAMQNATAASQIAALTALREEVETK